MLETARLILRRWKDSDAEDLYQYSGDPGFHTGRAAEAKGNL